MGFLSGIYNGRIPTTQGYNLPTSAPYKPAGGIFGTGIGGAGLAQGLGAAAGALGGQESIQHAPFPFPTMPQARFDPSGLQQPIQGPQVPPLDLSAYFQ